MLRVLRGLWQGLEHLDAGGEVVDGFQIGRAVTGVFARPLPVVHRLLGEARLRVMMRQPLGLRLGGLRKSLL